MAFNYSTMTYANRWKIKRWSHGTRFQVALNLAENHNANPRQVLDYGAGDGYFAKLHAARFKNCKIVAFDPSQNMIDKIQVASEILPEVTLVTSTSDIEGTYDVIYCQEVLEHLQNEEIIQIINKWKKIVSDNGIAIVSVPIETGISSIAKTIVRKIIGESHGKQYGVVNRLKAIAGIEIDRGNSKYINSHFGFSHRRLKKLLLASGLEILETKYSPVPWPFPINSQCFWVINLN